MKNLLVAFVTLSVIGLLSCGGADCVSSDWVGTWHLQGEDQCEANSGSSTSAKEAIEITAGETDEEVRISRTIFNIAECKVSFSLSEIELQGDVLIVTIQGCDYEYKR